MTDHDSRLPPPAYFEELAALQLLVPRAKALHALADAYDAAPAAPVRSARQFIEWLHAQPEGREPTTAEGALLEFEAHIAATVHHSCCYAC